MLDVRRLRALHEVARRGSIAAAADALSFTPSAVSQQLTKLERETGVPLLERGPRSVRLTAAGERLAERAGAILRQLEEAEAELAATEGGRVVRLGSFPTAAAIVAEAVSLLGAFDPHVDVVVTEADPLVSLALVEQGELEAAVLFEYDYVPLPERERVALRLLLEEPFLVVLPTGHPATRQRAVQLVELADETWIRSTPRSSCHPFTARACRAAGFEPRIGFEFDDYQALQSLVAARAGVALAPALALGVLQPGVETRPVAFHAPRRRVYCATRSRTTGRPDVAALAAALEAAASARTAPPPAASADIAG